MERQRPRIASGERSCIATVSVVIVETQQMPATKAAAITGGRLCAGAMAAMAAANTSDEAPTSLSLPQRWRALPIHRAAKIDPAPNPPRQKIGRAHVCTPVTNAHLVCRLLLVPYYSLLPSFSFFFSLFLLL